jgi:hypothetical protein
MNALIIDDVIAKAQAATEVKDPPFLSPDVGDIQ